MKILSRDQFSKARNYLKTQARHLELALFEYRFEGLPADHALLTLSQYQNSDGGFGKALEPDMRSPSSSALATEIGLRTLVDLGATYDHSLVSSAVCYLLNSLNQATKTWRVVPLDVNEYPHAPWWHDESGSLAKTFDSFKIIPRAGILASLYHFAEFLPDNWLFEITQATITDILEMDQNKFLGGGDALVYAQRLAETPYLPQENHVKLVDRICQLAEWVVTRDPAAWSQYSIPPLKLAPSPQSTTASVLVNDIPANLDYLIDSQNPLGFWDVTWAWNNFPVEWENAKNEWRGILTLQALQTLSEYGRIMSS